MRVIPTKGRKEIEKLAPEIEMFFKEEQCQVLGQSFRKPGQVMHEKEWITYVNKETDKVRKGLNCNNVLSSHSFTFERRVSFTEGKEVSSTLREKSLPCL